MTNEQVAAWRLVGADMGLEFDELGHPYQPGPARDIDGSQYTGCFDWRPLESDADAFRLMIHYGLTYKLTSDFAYAWTEYGKALSGVPLAHFPGDPAGALRQALFLAAAHLVRQTLREIDATPTSG